MLVLDTPQIPPQSGPVVMVQSDAAKGAADDIKRAIGICHIVPNGEGREISAENMIQPGAEAGEYFRLYERRDVKGDGKITVLLRPDHGVLRSEGVGVFSYEANPGYRGPDAATVIAEINGKKVKVVYFFQAIGGVAIGSTTYKRLCGQKGYRWKILPTS